MENLIRLADADKKIAKGIDSFSMDLFYVFCKMLDELSAKLPTVPFRNFCPSRNAAVGSYFRMRTGNGTGVMKEMFHEPVWDSSRFFYPC